MRKKNLRKGIELETKPQPDNYVIDIEEYKKEEDDYEQPLELTRMGTSGFGSSNKYAPVNKRKSKFITLAKTADLDEKFLDFFDAEAFEEFKRFYVDWRQYYQDARKSSESNMSLERLNEFNEFISDLQYLTALERGGIYDAKNDDIIEKFEKTKKKLKNTADYYKTESTYLKPGNIYSKVDWLLSSRTFTISFLTTIYTLYGEDLSTSVTIGAIAIWLFATTYNVVNRMWNQSFIEKTEDKKESIGELNYIYNEFMQSNIRGKKDQFEYVNFISMYITTKIFEIYGKENFDELSMHRTTNSIMSALLQKRYDEFMETKKSFEFGGLQGFVDEMQYDAENIMAIGGGIFNSIESLIKEQRGLINRNCFTKCFGCLKGIFSPKYHISLSHYDVLQLIQEKVNVMTEHEKTPKDAKHRRSSSAVKSYGDSLEFDKGFRFLFFEGVLDRSDVRILIHNSWRGLFMDDFIKIFDENGCAGCTKKSKIFDDYQGYLMNYGNKSYFFGQILTSIFASVLIGATEFAELINNSLAGYLTAIAIFWGIASTTDFMIKKKIMVHESFNESFKKVKEVFKGLAYYGLIDAVKGIEFDEFFYNDNVMFKSSFATSTIFTIVEKTLEKLLDNGIDHNQLPIRDKAIIINQCIISAGNMFLNSKDTIKFMQSKKIEQELIKNIFEDIAERYGEVLKDLPAKTVGTLFKDILKINSNKILEEVSYKEPTALEIEKFETYSKVGSLSIEILQDISRYVYASIEGDELLMRHLESQRCLGVASRSELEKIDKVSSEIANELKGYIMGCAAKNNVPKSFFYDQYNCMQKLAYNFSNMNFYNTFVNIAVNFGEYINVFKMCCCQVTHKYLNYGKFFQDSNELEDNIFGTVIEDNLCSYISHVESSSRSNSETENLEKAVKNFVAIYA